MCGRDYTLGCHTYHSYFDVTKVRKKLEYANFLMTFFLHLRKFNNSVK